MSKTFAIEDTSDSCYRDLALTLEKKGWRKATHRKRTSLEKKRILQKDLPFLIWTISDKNLDFVDLETTNTFQVCNHYEGLVNALTTKQGFCDLMRMMPWSCADGLDISPRSYNLGDGVQREEFIDDFKITAAVQIIKWAVRLHVLMSPFPPAQLPQPPPPPPASTITTTAAAAAAPASVLGMRKDGRRRNTSNCGVVLPLTLPATLTKELLEAAVLACSKYLRMKTTGDCVDEQSFSANNNNNGGSSSSSSSSSSGKHHPIASTTPTTTEPSSSSSSSSSNNNNPPASSSKGNSNSSGGENATYAEIDMPETVYGLKETEWDSVLALSYELAELGEQKDCSRSHTSSSLVLKLLSMKHPKVLHCPAALRLVLLLRSVARVKKQFFIDGWRNIWVVKAPDVSRGVGMQLLHRLEDVLDCERGMGCRTVQKYVETPLLASGERGGGEHVDETDRGPFSPTETAFRGICSPVGRTTTSLPAASDSPSPSSAAAAASKVKFDIRVWVLVTSLEPNNLKAFVYSAVYGRRCSVPYNDDVSNLGDTYVHLTNYSIQKKAMSAAGAAGGATTCDRSTRTPMNPLIDRLPREAGQRPGSGLLRSRRRSAEEDADREPNAGPGAGSVAAAGAGMWAAFPVLRSNSLGLPPPQQQQPQEPPQPQKQQQPPQQLIHQQQQRPQQASGPSPSLPTLPAAGRVRPLSAGCMRSAKQQDRSAASGAKAGPGAGVVGGSGQGLDGESDDLGKALLLYHDEIVKIVDNRGRKLDRMGKPSSSFRVRPAVPTAGSSAAKSRRSVDATVIAAAAATAGTAAAPAATRTTSTVAVNEHSLQDFASPSSPSIESAWTSFVWPEIKRKIMASLEAVQTSSLVTARARSFEFLGYDVLIDENLNPWILEVNMSPAMAHRCERQNAVIRHMAEGIIELAVMPFARGEEGGVTRFDGGARGERCGGDDGGDDEEYGVYEDDSGSREGDAEPEVDVDGREGSSGDRERPPGETKGPPLGSPRSPRGFTLGAWEPLVGTAVAATPTANSQPAQGQVHGRQTHTHGIIMYSAGSGAAAADARRHSIGGMSTVAANTGAIPWQQDARQPSRRSNGSAAPAGAGATSSAAHHADGSGHDPLPARRPTVVHFSAYEVDDLPAGPVRPAPPRPRSAAAGLARARQARAAPYPSHHPAYNAAAGSGGLLAMAHPSGLVVDKTFVAVGSAISKKAIAFADLCCVKFGKALLLQRWARRYLERLRLYNHRRRCAATEIQRVVRRLLAQRLLVSLRRHFKATVIQCQVRRRISQRLLICLRRARAATEVQRVVRGYVAKCRRWHLRRARAARRIVRWLRQRWDVCRRKAAFRIVQRCRPWLRWRKMCKRRVFYLVAWHYRRRLRSAAAIKKLARRWLGMHFARKAVLKQLAMEAQVRVAEITKARAERARLRLVRLARRRADRAAKAQQRQQQRMAREVAGGAAEEAQRRLEVRCMGREEERMRIVDRQERRKVRLVAAFESIMSTIGVSGGTVCRTGPPSSSVSSSLSIDPTTSAGAGGGAAAAGVGIDGRGPLKIEAWSAPPSAGESDGLGGCETLLTRLRKSSGLSSGPPLSLSAAAEQRLVEESEEHVRRLMPYFPRQQSAHGMASVSGAGASEEGAGDEVRIDIGPVGASSSSASSKIRTGTRSDKPKAKKQSMDKAEGPTTSDGMGVTVGVGWGVGFNRPAAQGQADISSRPVATNATTTTSTTTAFAPPGGGADFSAVGSSAAAGAGLEAAGALKRASRRPKSASATMVASATRRTTNNDEHGGGGSGLGLNLGHRPILCLDYGSGFEVDLSAAAFLRPEVDLVSRNGARGVRGEEAEGVLRNGSESMGRKTKKKSKKKKRTDEAINHVGVTAASDIATALTHSEGSAFFHHRHPPSLASHRRDMEGDGGSGGGGGRGRSGHPSSGAVTADPSSGPVTAHPSSGAVAAHKQADPRPHTANASRWPSAAKAAAVSNPQPPPLMPFGFDWRPPPQLFAYAHPLPRSSELAKAVNGATSRIPSSGARPKSAGAARARSTRRTSISVELPQGMVVAVGRHGDGEVGLWRGGGDGSGGGGGVGSQQHQHQPYQSRRAERKYVDPNHIAVKEMIEGAAEYLAAAAATAASSSSSSSSGSADKGSRGCYSENNHNHNNKGHLADPSVLSFFSGVEAASSFGNAVGALPKRPQIPASTSIKFGYGHRNVP